MPDWSKTQFNGGSYPKEWSVLIKRLLEGKKSVLDIGCGDGRFTSFLKDFDYLGVDISQKNIDVCKKNHPKTRFECADLTKWDTKKKYDVVFSWVALQHINPLQFDELARKISKWGKYIILCEHVEEPGENDYLWKHDYDRYFNITFTEPIVDKVKLLFGTTKK